MGAWTPRSVCRGQRSDSGSRNGDAAASCGHGGGVCPSATHAAMSCRSPIGENWYWHSETLLYRHSEMVLYWCVHWSTLCMPLNVSTICMPLTISTSLTMHALSGPLLGSAGRMVASCSAAGGAAPSRPRSLWCSQACTEPCWRPHHCTQAGAVQEVVCTSTRIACSIRVRWWRLGRLSSGHAVIMTSALFIKGFECIWCPSLAVLPVPTNAPPHSNTHPLRSAWLHLRCWRVRRRMSGMEGGADPAFIALQRWWAWCQHGPGNRERGSHMRMLQQLLRVVEGHAALAANHAGSVWPPTHHPGGPRLENRDPPALHTESLFPGEHVPWLTVHLTLPAVHIALHDGTANHHAVALEMQQLVLTAAVCAVRGSIQGSVGSCCLRTTLREARGALMQCPDPAGSVNNHSEVCASVHAWSVHLDILVTCLE